MSTPGIERCLSFIGSQLRGMNLSSLTGKDGTRPLAVTISRQAGSGAHSVAENLAELLDRRMPGEGCRWTVFDRNLVEKVLEDHHLPARLEKFMPEDRISEVSDIMNQLFGLHPPMDLLVRKTSQTILSLAELGNVIIIGRGGAAITARLPNVIRVRLIASPERRLAHLVDYYRMDPKTAREFLESTDKGRDRYLRKYFHEAIDDPLLYHLVINTDRVSYERAAWLIAETMLATRTELARKGRAETPGDPSPARLAPPA